MLLFIFIIAVSFMWLFYKRKRTADNRIFYTTKDYPEMKSVEDNWRIIKREIPEFDSSRDYPMRDKAAWNNDKGEALFESLKNNETWVKGWWNDVEWYQFPLVYHNRVIGKADTICPETVKLLQQIPSIQIAGYALLLPKTTMPVHTDATGKRFNSMAVNMGLKSYDSYLYVKDKSEQFQSKKHGDGNLIIFDSTFEHYAENLDKDNIRVILYMDFKTNTIFGKQIKKDDKQIIMKMHRKLEEGVYLAKYINDYVLVYADGSDVAKCIFKEEIDNPNDIYLKTVIYLNDKVRESIIRSFN
ncbi:MAG: aspartyl/asparaginyl beta-hydroxylase domain-containing protein [Melioribacteraceae bacterium]|nr:aspartyl/asparaginyl beta-hydroxylase domain-containing protein [Melioribacteraceae bacterium]